MYTDFHVSIPNYYKDIKQVFVLIKSSLAPDLAGYFLNWSCISFKY